MPESNSKDFVKLLKDWKSVKWVDWIEDILYYNIAFPFSVITPGRDILEEIREYLTENKISPREYELALIIVSQKLMKYEETTKLSRMMDVMQPMANLNNLSLFKSILEIKTNNSEFLDNVISKALLGLSKLPLPENNKDSIHDFILANQQPLTSSPAFTGNYLRFLRNMYSPDEFFIGLTNVIISHNTHKMNDKWEQAMAVTLEDKIRELHYTSPDFYFYFYKWLIRDFDSIENFSITNKILTKFHDYLAKFGDPLIDTTKENRVSYFTGYVKELLNALLGIQTYNANNVRKLEELCKFLLKKNGITLFRHIKENNRRFLNEEIACFGGLVTIGSVISHESEFEVLLLLRDRFQFQDDEGEIKSAAESVKKHIYEEVNNYE